MTAFPHSVSGLLASLLSHNQLPVIIEFLLVLGAAAVAWAFPYMGAKFFRTIERWGGRLARRRTLAVLVVGLLALAARVALLPIEPVPQPFVHDEFSYLLAADTFAQGRLTNPTHPLWEHFETLHVLQKPTYMSMFYPAQGLVLAAGQAVAGHPFWGVWFSVGVMCAAICWMLQGWVPPAWALLGGLLVVFRLAMFSYWGGNEHAMRFSYWDNSYWGGAVAATGGALVLGALPRLRRSLRVRDAVLLGLGLAILANSRPYEGLFLGLAVALVAAVWVMGKKRPALGLISRRVAAPLLVVLALTVGAMGYYFWRVTGSPFHTPYLAVTATYNPVPYFPWQSMKPIPQYHNQAMKDYYLGWQFDGYKSALEHPGEVAFKKVRTLATFYLGPLLLMPIAALLLVKRGRFFSGLARPNKARVLLVVCLITMMGMAFPVFFNPHYAAPLAGALVALVLLAMRHLWMWQWRGRPVGRQLARAVPVLAVAMMALHSSGVIRPRGVAATTPDFGRSRILAQLRGDPGGQLVVVQYSINHNPLEEWVYNRADIDAAKVVWARDMGPAGNEELLRYFNRRHVWLLKADQSPPQLLPYGRAEKSDPASANLHAQ